jgi:pilus assembly protein Flp/PilA
LDLAGSSRERGAQSFDPALLGRISRPASRFGAAPRPAGPNSVLLKEYGRGESAGFSGPPRPRQLEESMKMLAKKLQRFLVSEDGPTAVEYAVMLALIVIVCLTAIQAIGTNANSTFNRIANSLSSTSSSS